MTHLHISSASRVSQLDAFASVRGVAATIRAQALVALVAYGPMTADEIADALGRTVLAVRPRITELKALKLIVETGERRVNASGRKAAVFRRRA